MVLKIEISFIVSTTCNVEKKLQYHKDVRDICSIIATSNFSLYKRIQDRMYFGPLCLPHYSIVSNAQNTPFALSCNYAERMDNRGGEAERVDNAK